MDIVDAWWKFFLKIMQRAMVIMIEMGKVSFFYYEIVSSKSIVVIKRKAKELKLL